MIKVGEFESPAMKAGEVCTLVITAAVNVHILHIFTHQRYADFVVVSLLIGHDEILAQEIPMEILDELPIGPNSGPILAGMDVLLEVRALSAGVFRAIAVGRPTSTDGGSS